MPPTPPSGAADANDNANDDASSPLAPQLRALASAARLRQHMAHLCANLAVYLQSDVVDGRFGELLARVAAAARQLRQAQRLLQFVRALDAGLQAVAQEGQAQAGQQS